MTLSDNLTLGYTCRGKIPFEDKEDKEVLQHLRVLCKQEPTDIPSMRVEDRLPLGVRGLLYSCISLRVSARPTFGKLVLETLPHCWKQLLHMQDSTGLPTSPQLFVRPGAEGAKTYRPLTGPQGPTVVAAVEAGGGYTVLTLGQGNDQESRL